MIMILLETSVAIILEFFIPDEARKYNRDLTCFVKYCNQETIGFAATGKTLSLIRLLNLLE